MSPTAARRKATRPNAVAEQRIEVRKTYKLYIGGAFPRSESGRTYEVSDSRGRFLANAAMGSRKDARDADVQLVGLAHLDPLFRNGIRSSRLASSRGRTHRFAPVVT